MFARVAMAMAMRCAVAAVHTASAKAVHKLQDAFEADTSADGKPGSSDDDQKNACIGNEMYFDCLMSGPYPSFTYS